MAGLERAGGRPDWHRGRELPVRVKKMDAWVSFAVSRPAIGGAKCTTA
jgi:NOL1/NOP2/fmu family ribosome biogenesis protein